MRESALRWQCRRGMRELDELLLGWLDRHYESASKQRKAVFRDLLALPDPELMAYLLSKRVASDPDTADVIASIRDNAQT